MSFENQYNEAGMQKSNFFKMLLFSAAAFIVLIISAFIPFLGILGIALISIPSIKLMLEKRIFESIIAALVGSSVLSFIDWTLSLLFAFFIISSSFLYKYAVEKNKSPLTIIFANGFVFVIFIIIYIVFLSLIRSENVIASFLNYYKDVIESLPQDPNIQNYMKIMAIDDLQFKSIFEQSKNALIMIPYLMPAILVLYAFFASIVNYYWSFLIFKKGGFTIKQMPSFKIWDLPWYYIFGLIIGMVLVIIPDFNKSYDFLFDTVGINFLIVFAVLYSVLGFSVLWGIFDKFKFTSFLRILILIIMGFFIFLFALIPVLGVIDIWANFRKIERR